jgi:hypothetical protein
VGTSEAHRRLAGILAAEAVGYSAMVGADELGSLSDDWDEWKADLHVFLPKSRRPREKHMGCRLASGANSGRFCQERFTALDHAPVRLRLVPRELALRPLLCSRAIP